jgi:integrase
MTTLLEPVPIHGGCDFSGLTAADAARVAAAISAERAPSTLASYASAWRLFARWCEDRGLASLPADPATVCAYLAERADRGLANATITACCAAIRYEHQRAGAPDPIADPTVGRVRRGLRRILGVAPRRQARALLTEDIRNMVDQIDRSTTAGARDRALLLLGFASALRRSELAELALDDVLFVRDGVLLNIRRSKGDPDAEGQMVAVAIGAHAGTDPVAALRYWIAVRGTRPGNVFTRVRSNGRATVESISGHTVRCIIRTRAAAAGIESDRVSGHSLRAGHATAAALAGVPLDRIAAQTRHKEISTLVRHYIRPLDAMANTSSRSLGL